MSSSEETSYCGLYCGNCFIRRDGVADQAQRLLAKFREIGFEQWAEGLASLNPGEMAGFAKWKACYEVLQAWDRMRCGHACRDGGGSSQCAIRDCCRAKAKAGCWECGEFASCPTLASIKAVNGEVNVNNIRRIREIGIDRFGQERAEDRRDRNFG